VRSNLQSNFGDKRTIEPLNGAEQRSEFRRLKYCSVMFRHWRRKRAFQRCGRITGCSGGGDGISEDLACKLPRTLCSFSQATLFDFLQGRKHFLRSNVGDR